MRQARRKETIDAFLARHSHLVRSTVEIMVMVARDNLYEDDVIDAVLSTMVEHQAHSVLAAAGVGDFTVFNTAARKLQESSEGERC